jgi:S-(hydroxymethyl)glutathione dehydrogenase/alcohol dehydrogenase
MKAAVMYEAERPLVVETIELEDPREGEVLVRLAASGVCHSDYSVIHGVVQWPTPCVLGHEGAGVVEAVGPGVTGVKAGDHCILATLANCGRCPACAVGKAIFCPTRGAGTYGTMWDGTSRMRKDGRELYSFAHTSTFCEHTVVPEEGVVPIRKEMPLDKAALIGCGVITGWGAAVNTAQVRPGSRVAVIGCGGIGLNTIQGAALAGALQIIAVDVLANKLEWARAFGATDTVNAREADAVARVRELAGGVPQGQAGVDYAFEAIGNTATIEQGIKMLGPGGQMLIIGTTPRGARISVDPWGELWPDRSLRVVRYGSARPHYDFPLLVDLYLAGKLKLDELVSRTYPLDEINTAFDELEAGALARGVILY